jgi:uncharacterized protein YdaU (DUF1376 family)
MTLPYYKRFPRDFLDGTVGMTLEQKGAYGIVLDLIFSRGGKLPDDPRYIAGQLGCSVRKWNSIKDYLISEAKLFTENGIISNKRADYLLEETRKYRDKQAENRKKPYKNSEETKPSSTSRERIQKTEDCSNEQSLGGEAPQPPKVKTRKVTKRGSRIAETWAPTPTDYAHASKRGLNPQEVNHEADQFRNHHLAKGTVSKDWAASWRTWCGNAVKWKSERKPSARADRHAERSAIFAEVAHEFDYGSIPGRDGQEFHAADTQARHSDAGSQATLIDADGSELTWSGSTGKRVA